jgi:OmcA/MtrC family decaheme c-type cytochrome
MTERGKVGRRVAAVGVCAIVLCAGMAGLRVAASPLPEDYFQYNILKIENTAPGQFPKVTFSVTNPLNGNVPYNIKTDPPFTATADGSSRLFVQIAWSTSDYTNKGSGSQTAVPPAAAQPIAINALSASVQNPDLTFTVTSTKAIPADATGSGNVAMEGHPAQDIDGNGTLERLPVKSVYKHFVITGTTVVNRRKVVDIAKCKQCHQPHLSLHGNNRTDEIQVCVGCHNPNATDIAYRTSGPETAIDFKHMVHAIHGTARRQTPFIVIGRGGSVNDFSFVRFPAEPSNCLACHIDGTFSLPLGKNVLATTVSTGSNYGPPKVVDGDPANDLNITPTAAVCSACHDSAKNREHMTKTGGASFATTQAAIDAGKVVERCANCHGTGKDKDVNRVHSIQRDGD